MRGATIPKHPAMVVVTEGVVRPDGNRVVVDGYVVNNHPDRLAKAIVIVAFFDENERPMWRPSSLFPLAGKGKRGVSMVGPEGSRGAYLFIGEVSY